MTIPIPTDEEERLKALDRYKVLDTPAEEAFDKITRLAVQMLDVPIALVSLIDRDRQWFLSRQGLDVAETSREVAFCAHAICGFGPLLVPDATADARFVNNPLVTGDPKIKFYAGAPLQSPDGHNLGTLCVIDRKPRAFSDDQLQLLTQLATMVTEQFEVRLAGQQAVKELLEQEAHSQELRHLAMTDPLTNAPNRRAFFEFGEKEWHRAKRYGIPLSLLAIDVDHFKHLNDTLGHSAGDDALKAIVDCINSSLRTHDVFGRMGGEEFTILIPHTDVSSARVLADRLREQLSTICIENSIKPWRITVSIGVTECFPDRETLEDALQRADAMLYVAKQRGRDRVECHVAA